MVNTNLLPWENNILPWDYNSMVNTNLHPWENNILPWDYNSMLNINLLPWEESISVLKLTFVLLGFGVIDSVLQVKGLLLTSVTVNS